MVSAVVAAVLAVAFPSNDLSCVATAAYWYKKDERGKGDGISEYGKAKRFPAFAVSPDSFLVADPLVRARHLDRIELLFNGDVVSAVEDGRFEDRGAVMLKAERPLKGVTPLRFGRGEPVEKLRWRWEGDTMVVDSRPLGTNDGVTVVASTGRTFRRGDRNALYLDKDGSPVGLEFGARVELAGPGPAVDTPDDWKRSPADSYEKKAEWMERRVASATLGVLFRLEAEDKSDSRNDYVVVRYYGRGDNAGKNEIDALGFAVGGRVIVPVDLGGDKISRISKVEATFPDGTTTNLVFAGALAEWNAVLFDVPKAFARKLQPLEVSSSAAEDFDNSPSWSMSVENENGRVVPTAALGRFCGVSYLRGARYAPAVEGSWSRSRYSRGQTAFVLDSEGRIASFALSRRYTADRWSRDESECVATSDLVRFMAGEGVNPEFAPRREEDRNRLVWLGVETVGLTDALARERKAQSFLGRYSRPPYVTEVYAGSPAEKAGLAVGDVLLAVRRGNEAERELEAENDYSPVRDLFAYFSSDYSFSPSATPWPDVENQLNKLMTTFGAGATITLVYARDGQRREVPISLEPAPVHYRNAGKSRNRSLGLSVRDMTFEVRRFFKFADDEPGVVIAKVKPGSPAAVAGLKPFELVTEVNGEKVTGARDFAAKMKTSSDLVLAVRRLAQTRIVKLHVAPEENLSERRAQKQVRE